MVLLDVFSREPRHEYLSRPERRASYVGRADEYAFTGRDPTTNSLQMPMIDGVPGVTRALKAEKPCITLEDVTVAPFIRLAILNALDGSSPEARKRLQMPTWAIKLGFLRSGSFFSVAEVESELKAKYPNGNFYTKIEKAWKGKIIDQDERELLHAMREMRNRYCHDLVTPVRLCEALDLLRTSAYILTKLLPDDGVK